MCVSWILGIRSYLLGTDTTNEADENAANAAAQEAAENNDNAAGADGDNNQQAAAPAPPPRPAPAPPLPAEQRNLGAVHQAIMQRDVPVGYQPYEKPTFFALRLTGLLFFMCISLVVGSLLTLTIPVWIGRNVMALWSVGGHITTQTGDKSNEVAPRPHELYTAAVGTYLCWILSRGIAIAVNLLPQGRAAVMDKIKQWIRVGGSYALPALIFVLMLGVIPMLFGLLLELVVIIPFRVPFFQTPIHFLWQDWALGVLYTKIAIALTLMGPDWHLKRAIERAYRDGLRDIDLKFLIQELASPVITCFGLALAVPYVLAHSIIPLFVVDELTQQTVSRLIYPVFFITVGILAYIYYEIKRFKKLYVAIKVDKYLVGQRLVNYEHRKRQQEAAEAAAVAAKEAEAAKNAEQEALDEVAMLEQVELERRRREANEQLQGQALLPNILRDDLML